MNVSKLYVALLVMNMLVSGHINYASNQDSFDNIQLMCTYECEREHILIQSMNFLPLLQEIVIDQSIQSDYEQRLGSVIACIERLERGCNNLHLDDLIDVMPLVLTYITKSSRCFWSASSSVASNSSSDFTEALRLLSIVRNRIGNVFQDSSALTILSTLGNPLELGSNVNLVRQLLRIQDECQETRTMVHALRDTLIACCNQLTDQIIANNNTLDNLTALVIDSFENGESTTYCNTANVSINAPSTIFINDVDQTSDELKDCKTTLSITTNNARI